MMFSVFKVRVVLSFGFCFSFSQMSNHDYQSTPKYLDNKIHDKLTRISA